MQVSDMDVTPNTVADMIAKANAAAKAGGDKGAAGDVDADADKADATKTDAAKTGAAKTDAAKTDADKTDASKALEDAQRAAKESSDRLDAVLVALGLNGEKDDPVAAAELAQKEARVAHVQLAVLRAAPPHVDANALLDSRSFLDKVSALDPQDSAGIKMAMEDFVQSNPRFQVTSSAPGAGLRDTSARTTAKAGAANINDLLRAAAGRS